jgi:hypothetical protein
MIFKLAYIGTTVAINALVLSLYVTVSALDIVPIRCEALTNKTQAQWIAANYLPCPNNINYVELAIWHALNIYAEQAGLLDAVSSLPYPDFSDVWWQQDDVDPDIWHDDYYDGSTYDDAFYDDTYNDDTYDVVMPNVNHRKLCPSTWEEVIYVLRMFCRKRIKIGLNWNLKISMGS